MINQQNDFRFSVNPEANASIHDDGVVILHLGSGQLYTSNETAASIWRRVEQQLSLEAIIAEISTEYQIACSSLREHVVHFLADLERHSLIQREVLS
jgi:hypothetical protein